MKQPSRDADPFDYSPLVTDAAAAAKRLLGSELIRTMPDGEQLRVRIVEVEAYDQSDPGSHSYRGRTARTEAMFGPAGHAYIYLIYGIYHCCNVVTGPDNYGEGALIRGVEPIEGVATMEQLRGKSGREVTNGPSKLCRALAIDKALYQHDLTRPPLQLLLRDPLPPSNIVTTTRIGLAEGKGHETLWRFYEKDNPYVSKP